MVVVAAAAAVSSTAAIASNAAAYFIFCAAFNVVCNAVSLCLESYFDLALNVVFTDGLLLLHADSNAVPKAFHFVFHVVKTVTSFLKKG